MVSSVEQATCPRIAIFATESVHQICQRNGLPNLSTLLRPWEHSVERVAVRISTYDSQQHAVFPLLLNEIEDILQDDLEVTGEVEAAGDLLDALGTRISRQSDAWLAQGLDEAQERPWYRIFKEAVIARRPITSYDTFGHPVAAWLCVSASEPSPLESLARLYAATSRETLFADKKYIDPSMFRYYVILHDNLHDDSNATKELLEQVKRAYGVHCAVLPICAFAAANRGIAGPLSERWSAESEIPNTRSDGFATLWNACLPSQQDTALTTRHDELQHARTASRESNAAQSLVEPGAMLGDRDAVVIKLFLREFVVQSLVPHMERCLVQWNESLAASRRGLTSRLFSAGRKFLGSGSAAPSRAGSPAIPASVGYDPIKDIYSHISTEAQTRRLADYAFMMQDYKLASHTYDQHRRDVQPSKAYRCFASSSRMAGMSLLCSMLQSTAVQPALVSEALQFAEDAIRTKENKTALDGLRAICLYAEILTSLREYARASLLLISAAGQIDEISSALWLEQAALALRQAGARSSRRQARTMLMAAHRYEQAGHRPQSTHCLEVIIDASNGLQWPGIEKQTMRSLIRQACATGHPLKAIESIVLLLRKSTPSAFSGAQEDSEMLQELSTAWKLLDDSSKTALASRDVCVQNAFAEPVYTRLDLPHQQVTARTHCALLPEDYIQRLFRDRSRPERIIRQGGNRTAGLGDKLRLTVRLRNPLYTTVSLTKIRIVCQDVREPNHILEDDSLSFVCPDRVELLAAEVSEIEVSVTARKALQFTVDHIEFLLNDMLQCRDSLRRKGSRLQKTLEQRVQASYAEDTSLSVLVLDELPSLKMELQLPERSLAGERSRACLVLSNPGQVPLTSLRLHSSHPHILSMVQMGQQDDGTSIRYDAACDTRHVANNIETDRLSANVLLQPLQANASISLDVWIYGSSTEDITVLAAYETKEQGTVYIAQASHRLTVDPSIALRVLDWWHDVGRDERNLLIEVSNSHLELPFVLTTLFAAGPGWQLSSSPAFETARLAPRQNLVCSVVFKQLPSTDQGSLSAQTSDFTAQQIKKLLNNESVLADAPGPISVTVSTTADHLPSGVYEHLVSLRAAHRRKSLSAAFSMVPVDFLPHSFTSQTEGTIDLAVGWCLADADRSGYIYQAELQVEPAKDVLSEILQAAESTAGGLYEESQVEKTALIASLRRSHLVSNDCPLRVSLVAPGSVDMPPSRRAKTVPFSIRCINVSTTSNLAITAHLNVKTSTNRTETTAMLVGKTRLEASVSPLEQIELATTAWLPRAGIYDLSNWRLSVREQSEQQSVKRDWIINGIQQHLRAVQP
ncbi:hypothetical protein E5Q_04757 [Mixia osmundae IAM 14324]|uniref:TPPC8 second Ig-like domain-containing protein n=1 Tax=Mixia osmundae (strain CBS 9802 / IAM 14324 / JCM 22182 / KY 12970) TaxID=764103 RepID=G7E5G5_MIXOS|nr:hypothetical protein E5Q_04757 [Mixia osmundae IAM 14324]